MISAIVLAAGRSTRMGRPKMLMPWGDETVIGHVVGVLQRAELSDILVVTGAERTAVEEKIADRKNVRATFNSEFAAGEMLGSLQCGVAAQLPETRAALVCLGDQPQVQEGSVRRVCAAFLEHGSMLVVPSHERRRGHPWLIARPLWDELANIRAPATARDFLNDHADEIQYVELETKSVVEDLDTPADHSLHQPSKPPKPR